MELKVTSPLWRIGLVMTKGPKLCPGPSVEKRVKQIYLVGELRSEVSILSEVWKLVEQRRFLSKRRLSSASVANCRKHFPNWC